MIIYKLFIFISILISISLQLNAPPPSDQPTYASRIMSVKSIDKFKQIKQIVREDFNLTTACNSDNTEGLAESLLYCMNPAACPYPAVQRAIWARYNNGNQPHKTDLLYQQELLLRELGTKMQASIELRNPLSTLLIRFNIAPDTEISLRKVLGVGSSSEL